MTQPEYEKAKQECWDRCADDVGIIGYTQKLAHDYAFDRAYALGKHEKEADTVIQGWVARDKGGSLYIHEAKPKYNEWSEGWDNVGFIIPLNSGIFPDLTWESEPLEVEIIIKRKQK